MITTLRYAGKAKKVQDGKAIDISIPPPIVLTKTGAFIDVTITHPKTVSERIREKGESIPTFSTKALIDTGASSSIISPKIAEKLKLLHTGYQKVASVHDEKDRPVYYGLLLFPWGKGKEIPLICCDLKNFECLIGRDILQHWCFTYNGTDGSVIICD
ncbi:retroviral-like aspartic protease [Candidatus Saganbacteria bacterium]|nr:retroviral-like aspartic protease [Candidatus Saganbacteria bacterium]